MCGGCGLCFVRDDVWGCGLSFVRDDVWGVWPVLCEG